MERKTLAILLRDSMSAENTYLEILKKEQERNELLKEISVSVGFDISFSDEMIMQNARDAFVKAYDKELKEKLRIWMK